MRGTIPVLHMYRSCVQGEMRERPMTMLRSKWRVRAACAVIAMLALGVIAVPGTPAGGQSTDAQLAARLLEGAIDVHAHVDPDSAGPATMQRPRLLDVDDVARVARERGMRGFVAKMHNDTTAHISYLVRKAVPGVEVFGLLGLNRAMGGINPAAVAQMAEVKGGWGRIVNMPTYDAEFYVATVTHPRRPKSRPFVSVSRGGQLLPEVKEIIATMAKTKTRDSNGQMALYTGHNSPAESLMMAREARRLGVPVMVSHPMIDFINMPVPMMEEAAKLGAYIEIVTGWVDDEDADAEARRHADVIRKIGPEHFILSSDRGQPEGPNQPDGLVLAARALMKHGMTEVEINRMLKENPARLLGLRP